MKNKLFWILCLGWMLFGDVTTMEAAIYRLGWWGAPVANKDFRWDQYADLETMANANDTVQVYPASNVPTITVGKPLRFIGYGFLLTTNNGYQYNKWADYPFHVNLISGSEGTIIQGVSAAISAEVGDFMVRYSRMGHLHFNNGPAISNVTVMGCWFDLPGYSNHISSMWWGSATVTNLKIVNNYLNNVYLGGNSSGTIANNVFAVNATDVNLDYTSAGSSNFLIKNNIVTNDNYWQCFFTNNTGVIKNNLFAFAQANCPLITGNGNVYGVNMNITFQNWNNGVLAGDSSLRIPAGSPAINAGQNNANASTNCGIYGGETAEVYRQSGIPTLPAIYAFSTPTQTPTGSTMACTTSVRSNNASNISRIEYYVDADPGYGLGTSVTFTAGTNVSGATFSVPLTSLTQGMHLLVVRSRDANGNWSMNNGFSFLKQLATVSAPALPNVSKMEYYIDNDPGFGLATNIPVTAATNITNITIPVNPTNVSEGLHTAYVRSRDANGKWSLTNAWTFMKPYGTVVASTVPNVTKLEYYIDNDPGFGLATNIPVTAATDISNLTIPVNPAALSEGMHTAYVRSRDANGKWSLTNAWTFMKPYGTVPAASKPKITQMEYYVDIDPGYGSAVQVALTSDTAVASKVISVNVAGLATGAHTIWVRTKDSSGNWSLNNAKDFNLVTAQTSPSVVTNSVSKKVTCAGETLKVTYDAKGTYNAGNIFTVQLSNSAGSFASPIAIGTYAGTGNATINCTLPSHLTTGTKYKIRVNSSNPAVTGIVWADSLWLRDRPVAQTITGVSSANVGTAYAFSVPTVSGSSWQWIVPTATVTPSANSASVNWTSAGVPKTVKVVQTSQYGCIGDTSSKNVNVYQLSIPAATPSVTGPCKGSSFTVSANVTGVFAAGNTFTAQLSNSAGSFASPVTIGSLSANPVGASQAVVVPVNLPVNTPNGNGYKVRIISSSPAVTGTASTSSVVVSNPNMGNDTTVTKCPDITFNLATLYNAAGITYQYYTSSYVLLATPTAVQNGSYRVIGTGSTGCKDTTVVTVSNFAKPSLGADQVIAKCTSETFNLTTLYTNPAFTYQYFSGAFVLVAAPVAVQAGIYQIVATNATGCKDTVQISINNNNTPSLGPDQVKYYLANTSYNLTTLYANPVFAYGYRKSDWSAVPNPASVTAGVYYIIATYNACKDTVKITVKLGKPIALISQPLDELFNESEEMDMLIYPNPAHSQLSVDLNFAQATRASLQLFDMSGKLIREMRQDVEPGLQTLYIDVSHLAQGVYLIRYSDDQQHSLVRRFVKE